jgi:hypothetical protein
MKKFFLGLCAVLALLLPLSQNAQAHLLYVRKVYVYRHVYPVHREWHPGHWYAGFWHPGYWF